MTLKEFREATKNVDENAVLINDVNGNPIWYLVERPFGKDDIPSICMIDKSGMDLHAEIDAALEALGETDVIPYLIRNGVTLEEIKKFDEHLYEVAKNFVE